MEQSNQSLKLTKKHSFVEIYFKTIGVPITVAIFVLGIGITWFINHKTAYYVLAAICGVSVSVVVLLFTLTLFSFTIARFKSYLRLRYLPISVEEIKKLNIQTLDEYLVYISDFLKVNYINYFYLLSSKIEKHRATTTVIPKFITKEILDVISEYIYINQNFKQIGCTLMDSVIFRIGRMDEDVTRAFKKIYKKRKTSHMRSIDFYDFDIETLIEYALCGLMLIVCIILGCKLIAICP